MILGHWRFSIIWRPCHGPLVTQDLTLSIQKLEMKVPKIVISQSGHREKPFADHYSWVPNRQVYSFIRHQRNMKKETDTKTDKSI